jgi:hypothetical protein
MSLDDQLRAVLNEEAEMRTALPPDVQRLISGGQARRRRRNAVWVGGTVLAAVLAAGGVYGFVQLGGDADSVAPITKVPSPQPLPDIGGAIAIDPGTYVVPAGDNVVAPYTVTVPAGWQSQYGDGLAKNTTQGETVLEPFVLDRIRLTDDACTGPQTLGAAQSSVAGLVAALRAQGSGPTVGDPVAATVGGLAATRFELDYPGSQPLKHCRLSENVPGEEKGTLQIWSGWLVMHPTETASVYVVDVGGKAQVIVTRTRDSAATADRAELQSLLDSISFRRGAS